MTPAIIEGRKRQAEKMKGRDTWNKGMKGFNEGKIVSEETKEKQKIAQQKRREREKAAGMTYEQTEEHRKKNSEGVKAACARRKSLAENQN